MTSPTQAPPPLRQAPPAQRERMYLYGMVGALVLVLGLGCFYTLQKLHDGVTERVQTSGQNLATSVNQTLEGLFDTINVTLIDAADEITRQPVDTLADMARINRHLDSLAHVVPRVAYVRGTNAQGVIMFGPDIPSTSVKVDDREFFQYLRDTPTAGLYMAKPVVSKISGRSILTLARRVESASGVFMGTVYAVIHLSELQDMLSEIQLEPGASLALRDRDMGLITRKVAGTPAEMPVGDARISEAFTRALQQNPLQGTYQSPVTALDNVPRSYAYLRSGKYGYVINVGLPLDTAYRDWRRQVAVVLGLALLLVLASLVLARQISISRRRMDGYVHTLTQSQAALERQHLQLVRAEEGQRALLQNLYTGVVVHAPDGRIVFSNACASRLMGLSPAQMLGKEPVDPAWSFTGLDGQALAHAHYPVARVLQTRQPLQNFVMGVRKPQSFQLTWVEGSAFPDFDENGQLKQVVVNFYDITERRQAEKASARAARALRLLSDTNITLARSDDQTQLLRDICQLVCERGGYRMAWVGFAQDDADKSVHSAAHWGFKDGYLETVRISWDAESPLGQSHTANTIRTGRTQVDRNYLSNPQMVPSWREAAVVHGCQSGIYLALNQKTGMRGVLAIYASQEDAFNTDEVVLLEELAGNLAYGLDAMEDRKRRIAAESASQAKAQFLANMSHEIRTPLNAITGMAHLVRREPLSPSQGEKLAKLEAASGHLLRIINAILDLSKIEAGKFTLDEASLNVPTLVANVLAMVSERAAEKGLEVRSELPALPAHLVGDATRLQQAMLNYLGNAIKFTEAGTVTLQVQLEEETEHGARLRFAVQDTGIGIATDALQRLFSAFEQADNTMTRRYGGTGLGLAITSKLAQLMGGEAGVHSTQGQGSTFWFTAQLRKDRTAARESPAAERPHARDALQSQYPALRVLVAEDEPVNREITTILLEDIGCVVDVAEDGLEAVEKAAQQRYGLVIMDMQMPRLNGLDATRRIRVLPGYADIPIIAMTANAFAEDRARCFEVGMNGFVSKPVPAAELYSAMLQALEDAPKD